MNRILLFIISVGVLIWIFSRLRNADDCTVLQTIPLDYATIEIVNDQCKEGLPHTTGPRTVRMVRSIWDGPRRDSVLKHERVHLSQKSHTAEEWRRFYEREWGYTCFQNAPPGVPAELRARLRPNPDTSDSPWAVWRDRWLFFPAFGNDGSLRKAEVIVWDLENHRQVGIPDGWRDAFCARGDCPFQYEHPHEISAEWLTAGSDVVKAPAAAKLFAWNK